MTGKNKSKDAGRGIIAYAIDSMTEYATAASTWSEGQSAPPPRRDSSGEDDIIKKRLDAGIRTYRAPSPDFERLLASLSLTLQNIDAGEIQQELSSKRLKTSSKKENKYLNTVLDALGSFPSHARPDHALQGYAKEYGEREERSGLSHSSAEKLLKAAGVVNLSDAHFGNVVDAVTGAFVSQIIKLPVSVSSAALGAGGISADAKMLLREGANIARSVPSAYVVNAMSSFSSRGRSISLPEDFQGILPAVKHRYERLLSQLCAVYGEGTSAPEDVERKLSESEEKFISSVEAEYAALLKMDKEYKLDTSQKQQQYLVIGQTLTSLVTEAAMRSVGYATLNGVAPLILARSISLVVRPATSALVRATGNWYETIAIAKLALRKYLTLTERSAARLSEEEKIALSHYIQDHFQSADIANYHRRNENVFQPELRALREEIDEREAKSSILEGKLGSLDARELYLIEKRERLQRAYTVCVEKNGRTHLQFDTEQVKSLIDFLKAKDAGKGSADRLIVLNLASILSVMAVPDDETTLLLKELSCTYRDVVGGDLLHKVRSEAAKKDGELQRVLSDWFRHGRAEDMLGASPLEEDESHFLDVYQNETIRMEIESIQREIDKGRTSRVRGAEVSNHISENKLNEFEYSLARNNKKLLGLRTYKRRYEDDVRAYLARDASGISHDGRVRQVILKDVIGLYRGIQRGHVGFSSRLKGKLLGTSGKPYNISRWSALVKEISAPLNVVMPSALAANLVSARQGAGVSPYRGLSSARDQLESSELASMLTPGAVDLPVLYETTTRTDPGSGLSQTYAESDEAPQTAASRRVARSAEGAAPCSGGADSDSDRLRESDQERARRVAEGRERLDRYKSSLGYGDYVVRSLHRSNGEANSFVISLRHPISDLSLSVVWRPEDGADAGLDPLAREFELAIERAVQEPMLQDVARAALDLPVDSQFSGFLREGKKVRARYIVAGRITTGRLMSHDEVGGFVANAMRIRVQKVVLFGSDRSARWLGAALAIVGMATDDAPFEMSRIVDLSLNAPDMAEAGLRFGHVLARAIEATRLSNPVTNVLKMGCYMGFKAAGRLGPAMGVVGTVAGLASIAQLAKQYADAEQRRIERGIAGYTTEQKVLITQLSVAVAGTAGGAAVMGMAMAGIATGPAAIGLVGIAAFGMLYNFLMKGIVDREQKAASTAERVLEMANMAKTPMTIEPVRDGNHALRVHWPGEVVIEGGKAIFRSKPGTRQVRTMQSTDKWLTVPPQLGPFSDLKSGGYVDLPRTEFSLDVPETGELYVIIPTGKIEITPTYAPQGAASKSDEIIASEQATGAMGSNIAHPRWLMVDLKLEDKGEVSCTVTSRRENVVVLPIASHAGKAMSDAQFTVETGRADVSARLLVNCNQRVVSAGGSVVMSATVPQGYVHGHQVVSTSLSNVEALPGGSTLRLSGKATVLRRSPAESKELERNLNLGLDRVLQSLAENVGNIKALGNGALVLAHLYQRYLRFYAKAQPNGYFAARLESLINELKITGENAPLTAALAAVPDDSMLCSNPHVYSSFFAGLLNHSGQEARLSFGWIETIEGWLKEQHAQLLTYIAHSAEVKTEEVSWTSDITLQAGEDFSFTLNAMTSDGEVQALCFRVTKGGSIIAEDPSFAEQPPVLREGIDRLLYDGGRNIGTRRNPEWVFLNRTTLEFFRQPTSGTDMVPVDAELVQRKIDSLPMLRDLEAIQRWYDGTKGAVFYVQRAHFDGPVIDLPRDGYIAQKYPGLVRKSGSRVTIFMRDLPREVTGFLLPALPSDGEARIELSETDVKAQRAMLTSRLERLQRYRASGRVIADASDAVPVAVPAEAAIASQPWPKDRPPSDIEAKAFDYMGSSRLNGHMHYFRERASGEYYLCSDIPVRSVFVLQGLFNSVRPLERISSSADLRLAATWSRLRNLMRACETTPSLEPVILRLEEYIRTGQPVFHGGVQYRHDSAGVEVTSGTRVFDHADGGVERLCKLLFDRSDVGNSAVLSVSDGRLVRTDASGSHVLYDVNAAGQAMKFNDVVQIQYGEDRYFYRQATGVLSGPLHDRGEPVVYLGIGADGLDVYGLENAAKEVAQLVFDSRNRVTRETRFSTDELRKDGIVNPVAGSTWICGSGGAKIRSVEPPIGGTVYVMENASGDTYARIKGESEWMPSLKGTTTGLEARLSDFIVEEKVGILILRAVPGKDAIFIGFNSERGTPIRIEGGASVLLNETFNRQLTMVLSQEDENILDMDWSRWTPLVDGQDLILTNRNGALVVVKFSPGAQLMVDGEEYSSAAQLELRLKTTTADIALGRSSVGPLFWDPMRNRLLTQDNGQTFELGYLSAAVTYVNDGRIAFLANESSNSIDLPALEGITAYDVYLASGNELTVSSTFVENAHRETGSETVVYVNLEGLIEGTRALVKFDRRQWPALETQQHGHDGSVTVVNALAENGPVVLRFVPSRGMRVQLRLKDGTDNVVEVELVPLLNFGDSSQLPDAGDAVANPGRQKRDTQATDGGCRMIPKSLAYLDLPKPAPRREVTNHLYRTLPRLGETLVQMNDATGSILRKSSENDATLALAPNDKARQRLVKGMKFRKSALKGFAAHAGVYNDQTGVLRDGFTNLEGSLSPAKPFPGIELIRRNVATHLEQYAPEALRTSLRWEPKSDLGQYRVTDIELYMAGVKKEYEKPENGSVPMHPIVEARIRAHIVDNGYILPIKAGIAGLHAEVRALNAALVELASEKLGWASALTRSYIFTKRLVGEANTDFPACHNCKGILSGLEQVMTGVVDDYSPLERSYSITSTQERQARGVHQSSSESSTLDRSLQRTRPTLPEVSNDARPAPGGEIVGPSIVDPDFQRARSLVEDDARIKQAVASPKEKCELAAGVMMSVLLRAGVSCKVIGMHVWQSSSDSSPLTHFAVIARINGKEMIFDPTIGQFGHGSPFYGSKDDWVALIRGAHPTSLIRYGIADDLAKAKHAFSVSERVYPSHGVGLLLQDRPWSADTGRAAVANTLQFIMRDSRRWRAWKSGEGAHERILTAQQSIFGPLYSGRLGSLGIRKSAEFLKDHPKSILARDPNLTRLSELLSEKEASAPNASEDDIERALIEIDAEAKSYLAQSNDAGRSANVVILRMEIDLARESIGARKRSRNLNSETLFGETGAHARAQPQGSIQEHAISLRDGDSSIRADGRRWALSEALGADFRGEQKIIGFPLAGSGEFELRIPGSVVARFHDAYKTGDDYIYVPCSRASGDESSLVLAFEVRGRDRRTLVVNGVAVVFTDSAGALQELRAFGSRRSLKQPMSRPDTMSASKRVATAQAARSQVLGELTRSLSHVDSNRVMWNDEMNVMVTARDPQVIRQGIDALVADLGGRDSAIALLDGVDPYSPSDPICGLSANNLFKLMVERNTAINPNVLPYRPGSDFEVQLNQLDPNKSYVMIVNDARLGHKYLVDFPAPGGQPRRAYILQSDLGDGALPPLDIGTWVTRRGDDSVSVADLKVLVGPGLLSIPPAEQRELLARVLEVNRDPARIKTAKLRTDRDVSFTVSEYDPDQFRRNVAMISDLSRK